MPLKQRKQIILNQYNKVKNPNWQEADQLAKKRVQGFELGTMEKQIQLVARASLEPGTSGLQYQCPKPLGHACLQKWHLKWSELDNFIIFNLTALSLFV